MGKASVNGSFLNVAIVFYGWLHNLLCLTDDCACRGLCAMDDLLLLKGQRQQSVTTLHQSPVP